MSSPHMKLHTVGTKLVLCGKHSNAVCASQPEVKAWALSATGRRLASPQPVEVEETSSFLRPSLDVQPEASTSGRSSAEQAPWERFMYLMYKVRAMAPPKLRGQAKSDERKQEKVDELLLPLRVIASGKNVKDSLWLKKYYQELQVELGAQRQMQQRVVQAVESTLKRGSGADLAVSRSLIAHWIGPLTKAIHLEQKLILNRVPAVDRTRYGPALLLLPAHVLANATLHGLITSMLSADQLGVIKVVHPCIAIGKQVQRLVELDMLNAKARRVQHQRRILQRRIRSGTDDLKEEGNEVTLAWFQRWREGLERDPSFENADGDTASKEILQRFKKMKPYEVPDPADQDASIPLGTSVITSGKKASELELKEGPHSKVEKYLRQNAKMGRKAKLEKLNFHLNRTRTAALQWNQVQVVKVGAKLLELLMDNCLVTQWDPSLQRSVARPAATRYIQRSADRRQGWVRLHDGVTRHLQKVKEVKSFLLPAYQPMVIPPLSWRGVVFGGYLVTRTHVMRHRGFKAQKAALEEADSMPAPHPGLSQVYEALTALGETGWRINKDMLAAVEHAVEAELDICDLPSVHAVPIEQAVKCPRFRTMGGGFWQRKASRFEPFRLEQLDATAIKEAFPSVSAEQETFHDDRDDETPKILGEAPNMEAVVMSREGLSEGDALSGPSSRVRGIFRRTQLLVSFTDRETEFERRVRRMRNILTRKFNREQYSLRCDMKYKLEVANKFKNELAIYFPHNLDFRGRAYPMHPHLMHLGNDMCRGLLEFSEGRPLGPEGLLWLYIQIANSWGQGEDKNSFEGRQQFVQDNLENVRSSAREPYECTWWQAAEDPWQCLAACRAVDGAIASGNPETFVSHTPVMVDGSCNGLQHYAALSLDRPGAAAVNLTHADKPQDVYTQVADLVRERVTTDAEKGVQVANLILGEIDRKLVKQTVMTSVYGITFVGARDQIKRRLHERGWVGVGKFDKYLVANYTAQQTLAGLHERFSKAKLVMEWLTDCARRITEKGELVRWTTPLGLPVVQPYKKKEKLNIATSLQRIIVHSTKQRTQQPIQKGRQRSAFPPNYIHSLDSTHMMMTAIACKRAGLKFAGVHDSFWTHAADVSQLNVILREKFVELYKKPLLEDLARQFEAQGHELAPVPLKGDLDIEEVLRAPFFFS